MKTYDLQKDHQEAELMSFFLKVITDTCLLKRLLLNELPAMSYKARTTNVKMLLVNSGCTLNTQIMRMDIAMKQLHKEYLSNESLDDDGLNITKYLWKDVKSESDYSDTRLLHNLLLIVGIEINSFRMLELMSRSLNPKSVNKLLKSNLEEALANEETLLRTYQKCLALTC